MCDIFILKCAFDEPAREPVLRPLHVALEQRARDPSNSAISLAGVDVDLLRPRASLDALRDAAVGRAKRWFAETTGVGDADLEAAVLGLADALRRSAAEAATDVVHAAARTTSG